MLQQYLQPKKLTWAEELERCCTKTPVSDTMHVQQTINTDTIGNRVDAEIKQLTSGPDFGMDQVGLKFFYICT